MNIEFAKYELSQTLPAHKAIVRSVSTQGNQMMSASSDKTVKLYELIGGKYVELTTLDFFDDYIYSTCPRVGGGYAIGCGKVIFLVDEQGNPNGTLEGHQGNVCSLSSIDEQTIISGSWDATAIMWDIASAGELLKLEGHKYGVAVLGITKSKIISGSQDGILRLWDNGKETQTKQAHGDIIREIQAVPMVGFITCSNDETLKLWSNQLDLLATFSSHTGFVFSVKYFDSTFVSGSDDKTVKLWKGQGQLMQTIDFPGTVWAVALNNTSDIIAGSDDGKVRVFTADKERQATPEEIAQYEADCQVKTQEQGLPEEEVMKFPSIDQLTVLKGKKHDEVRIFRNNKSAEAYSWNDETQSWLKIGDVMGGNKNAKFYNGDKFFPEGQYDYIFDVEDDQGLSKKLPFNEGDSQMAAAEKFCLREGYSKHYMQQIINFLKQNTQTNNKAKQQQQQQQQQQQVAYEYIPHTQYTFYEQLNIQGLQKKLVEFNGEVGELALTEKELAFFLRQLDSLQTGAKIEMTACSLLTSKLLKWPGKFILPVCDFFRIFSLHHSSEQLFSGLESGSKLLLDIQRIILSEGQTNPILTRLLLQAICNNCQHNANSYALIKHISIIKDILSIPHVLQGDEKTANIVANIVLNLSICIYQKQTLGEGASPVLSQIIISQSQGQRDVEFTVKMCTSIGNLLMSKTGQIRQQCKEICYGYIKSLVLQSDNVHSLNCVEEVRKCINS